jgi:hypothetical protein
VAFPSYRMDRKRLKSTPADSIDPASKMAKLMDILIRLWKAGGGDVTPHSFERDTGTTITDDEFKDCIRNLVEMKLLKHISGASPYKLDDTGEFTFTDEGLRTAAELRYDAARRVASEH